MHHRDSRNTFDLDAIDLDGFARAVKGLRAEIDASRGPDDLRHLRRIERWGRFATAVGLATAPIAPNPLSAAALALGRATRWLLMHHVGHRGYDKVPDVPARFTARVFARGWRRFVDWIDWMVPEAWVYEHNILHHQHTGEPRDPDLNQQFVPVAATVAAPPVPRRGMTVVRHRPARYVSHPFVDHRRKERRKA